MCALPGNSRKHERGPKALAGGKTGPKAGLIFNSNTLGQLRKTLAKNVKVCHSGRASVTGNREKMWCWNSKDKAMQSNRCRLVELPKVDDPRGSLSYAEAGEHVPFEIRRIFFLHGVPEGVTRAGHALKTCEQFMVATSGEFSAIVDDGVSKSSFRLHAGGEGLYLPSRIWLVLEDFRPGSVCLVLASERYSEDAYIRSYDEFAAEVAERA